MTPYRSDFLNILTERGFIHQCSNFEGLDEKLSSGTCSAYIGYDPTGKSLHVGHLYTVMMLYWFQQSGHKPITLMGGGTAKVGDPSFKDKTRPLMDDATIDENIDSIQNRFGRFLRYGDGKTDAMMVNNNDWLDGLSYLEFIRDYGRHFTINRMLSFESVKLRLDREQPLTFLEFNYMIMQGYDFVELNRRYGTILQMGGSDQWGNIINGVELGRRTENTEFFALTAPLLMAASGQKMGKTEGGAVWLNDDLFSPYDYYQYWRNVEDADVIRLLKIFTILPMDEIGKLATLQGAEINEAKKILAFEATKLCHGEQAAIDAAETSRKTFEEGQNADGLPTVTLPADQLQAGINILELLVESGLVASKGEARRLIKGGGARVNDENVDDETLSYTLAADMNALKISSGKKKHVLIKAA